MPRRLSMLTVAYASWSAVEEDNTFVALTIQLPVRPAQEEAR